jgi:ATP-dependent DNA helicase DinG
MSIIKHFPYDTPREEQLTAINFGIDAFLNSDKRFCIIEAGTGVGKSAIGLTLARMIDEKIPDKEGYQPGSYFLTTQKILQRQYEQDFGLPYGPMKSIYSSTNYSCSFHKKNDCRTSQQMLRTADKKSRFSKACMTGCKYKQQKIAFLASSESVTNFPYFITESTFSGHIKPRKVLVIDEAHNTENVLSNFVEVSVSQYFAEKIVKCKWPDKVTGINFVKWIRNTYYPKLQSQILHFESQIESMGITPDKIKALSSLSLKYDMLTGHANKLDKFLKDYDKDNWVMEKKETEKRGYVKVVYRAIDVSKFAEDYLFRMGHKIIMMSATILNADAFAESLGISKDDYAAISIPSPFPEENRPIITAGVGGMNQRELTDTLPKLRDAVKAIMNEHPKEKGIIHCHTYRIARYLKFNIKDRKLSKRILIHNSDNRDEILKKHMTSKQPTVLLSPSMTEGVDLKGDLSRFQILCKVPYPWLGDPIIRKRMNKHPNWYPLQTAMTVVQSVGRSIRNKDDKAVTYILDADWNKFYRKHKNLFCEDFRRLIR